MPESRLRVAIIVHRENRAPLLLCRDFIVPPGIKDGEKIDVSYVSVFDKHEDGSVTKHLLAHRGKSGESDKVTFYDDPIVSTRKPGLDGRPRVFYDMRLNAAKDHLEELEVDGFDLE